ncbi:MAG: sulfatase, partial [Anaerolineales bacterium]|nr:sulfatase [Anaerolineales bacterium]
MMNGMANIETPEFLLSKIDDFGGPDAYNHYAVGSTRWVGARA